MRTTSKLNHTGRNWVPMAQHADADSKGWVAMRKVGGAIQPAHLLQSMQAAESEVNACALHGMLVPPSLSHQTLL